MRGGGGGRLPLPLVTCFASLLLGHLPSSDRFHPRCSWKNHQQSMPGLCVVFYTCSGTFATFAMGFAHSQIPAGPGRASNLLSNASREGILPEKSKGLRCTSGEKLIRARLEWLLQLAAQNLPATHLDCGPLHPQAVKKLDAIRVKIGYPDEWINYDDLKIDHDAGIRRAQTPSPRLPLLDPTAYPRLLSIDGFEPLYYQESYKAGAAGDRCAAKSRTTRPAIIVDGCLVLVQKLDNQNHSPFLSSPAPFSSLMGAHPPPHGIPCGTTETWWKLQVCPSPACAPPFVHTGEQHSGGTQRAQKAKTVLRLWQHRLWHVSTEYRCLMALKTRRGLQQQV